MSALLIVKPGLLTTVQDRGRWGLQAQGIPVAGPMDPRAHRVANALAGNPPAAATVEITLVGPEIVFEDRRVVAVAGAEFSLTLDGDAVPTHEPFVVSPGARLAFGPRAHGARAYLAVSGGVAVPRVLGSRSTHLPSGMGGFGGRALAAGDRVPLENASASSLPRTRRRPPVTPAPGGPAVLRVLPGPHRERFGREALDVLQSAPYAIGIDSDRMGFRLHGPQLQHTRGADIISDATPIGGLQVPASGQPVLLMADRQTTGGYPMIATLISADLAVAGQLAPGDALRFEATTRRVALGALIAPERALMALEDSA
jgi:antagonist of KipI